MSHLFNPWSDITDNTKAAIIRWAYLIIVIAATITLIVLVNQNKQIVDDIQHDRKQLVYDLCLDQNARNEELIQFLREEDALTPVAMKFVNLLAPKRNCKLVVLNTFGSSIDN